MVERRGDDECWPWVAGLMTIGYAAFTSDAGTVYAHRWAYERFIGPIPEGMHVDHTCHNIDSSCPGGYCAHRRCQNWSHFEAVPMRVNLQRGRNRLTLPRPTVVRSGS